MAQAIKLVIRDGRAGREGGPAGVGDGRGAILGIQEVSEPLDIGDKVRLADGTDVVVIGVTENFSASGWEQEVAIGNLP
jgi:hypothetical protein